MACTQLLPGEGGRGEGRRWECSSTATTLLIGFLIKTGWAMVSPTYFMVSGCKYTESCL